MLRMVFWLGITHNDVNTTEIEIGFPHHNIDLNDGNSRESRDEFEWGLTFNELTIGYDNAASNDYDLMDKIAPPIAPGKTSARIIRSEWDHILGNAFITEVKQFVPQLWNRSLSN